MANSELQPITARQALDDAHAHLDVALRYSADLGLPMGELEIEHLRQALAILTLLRNSQNGGAA